MLMLLKGARIGAFLEKAAWCLRKEAGTDCALVPVNRVGPEDFAGPERGLVAICTGSRAEPGGYPPVMGQRSCRL